MKSFTVVICSYKRSFLIKECIESVLHNSLLPDKIILIDQNYDYATYNKIISTFKNKRFKNYIIIRNLIKKGLTRSKNISLKQIKTKYVYFIDDDIILEKKYFQKNIKIMINNKAHAVSGVISNYQNNFFKNIIYYFFNHNIFRDNRYFFINYKKLNKNFINKTFHVPGGITCYDTNIFKKISFDEKYITHNYEDVEFNIRLKKIIQNPKLFINTNALAYDKLSKNLKENFNSRVYFMTLLYLRNKSFKNLIFYILSFTGFLISCIFSSKIKNLKNLKKIFNKVVLKSNN